MAAPGSPDFALHTLGWRAFQDLCAVVLREVWGQSVHSFADSNDGGRDGAFYGTWQQPADTTGVQDLPVGPFVLQCKHTKKADATLSPSDLDDEFDKAQALVRRGLCTSYVLLTNARVSGTSEATIRERLLQAGVLHPLVLDGQWVCDTIAGSQRLRTFVPRVYGLGDLSQILDERAYVQAQSLLGYLQEDLATFVVTDAYRHAVRAVQDHGFVLLLGEPAVGKSVIAATLAMTALDSWGCLTINAHNAEDLVRHWNPQESNQFFWIDDAFGAVRHEPQLTDSWSRHMRQVMTAVHGGAKVVLTSRDYIYRDARPYLKEYAYPLLHEQQVVVDVAQLPLEERRQILYNHISLGDQSPAVRAKLKPHLEAAAAQEPFHPEVARRLGQRAFTRRLKLSGPGISHFMGHPTEFLRTIYAQLGPDEKTALALTYQAGNQLPAPLSLGPVQEAIITRLGSTPAGVSRALQALTGTFLRLAAPLGEDTGQGWSFRHPTLQEGFAEFMAADPNLLGIYLSGLDWEAALTRLDCGGDDQRGTLIRVPTTLYPAVADRLRLIQPQLSREWAVQLMWCNFFATRCSDTFLKHYIEKDPDFIPRMTRLGSFLDSRHEPKVLARLHRAHLLGAQERKRVLEAVAELAVETPDAAWLRRPEWQEILSDDERHRLLQRVKEKLVPDLAWTLDSWRGSWMETDDPAAFYSALETELTTYREAFESIDPVAASAFEQALVEVEEMVTSAYEDPDTPPRTGHQPHEGSPTRDMPYGRSIFDDIDS
ncbi:hypothetical protein [Kitasatospora sp. GP30]|uniref:nSTAND3 domain-containing NTPase n=1 Tax=Kitasatospora sp. GP30 TaxID=3035084 RepID=UPI00118035E2|nr:hypothetical protein [Kitasatospora sp. GP30]